MFQGIWTSCHCFMEKKHRNTAQKQQKMEGEDWERYRNVSLNIVIFSSPSYYWLIEWKQWSTPWCSFRFKIFTKLSRKCFITFQILKFLKNSRLSVVFWTLFSMLGSARKWLAFANRAKEHADNAGKRTQAEVFATLKFKFKPFHIPGYQKLLISLSSWGLCVLLLL